MLAAESVNDFPAYRGPLDQLELDIFPDAQPRQPVVSLDDDAIMGIRRHRWAGNDR